MHGSERLPKLLADANRQLADGLPDTPEDIRRVALKQWLLANMLAAQSADTLRDADLAELKAQWELDGA